MRGENTIDIYCMVDDYIHYLMSTNYLLPTLLFVLIFTLNANTVTWS